MKLIYRIISRLSLALLGLMAVWAVAFYFIMVEEINDETDDSLEDYAYHLITRTLAGEDMPSVNNGTNNTYHLAEVSPEYAAVNPALRYADETVYMRSLGESEPARVLKTIFRDSEDRIFELTVAIPTFEKEDLQERILWWILILYAVLLGAVIAVNAAIIRRSFRPLYALMKWLDEVRFGEAVKPLSIETNITEFSRLNEAMMRSMHRGHEMFEEQRLFTGNASHELQTPIAVCRARLEMLAGDPLLGEAQVEQIASVLGTLDRLAGLNKTLLLLARIDNKGFTDCGDIDVDGLVQKLTEDYSEIYEHKGLAINVREEAIPKIRMSETLASVLWGNLLKNAFVHTPQGGAIEVAITLRGVAVSNDAKGGALDPELIFRRFWRDGTNESSAGLGLALVESICRLYGFRISYNFATGRHIFTVNF